MSGVTPRCMWCGSAGVHGAPCYRCQVPIAAPVQTVPQAGCPRCKTPLSPHQIAPDVTVHACDGNPMYRGNLPGQAMACRGVFVSPLAWSRIVGQPALAEAVDARLAPGMSRGGLVGMLRCPCCSAEMDRGPFAAKSPITIDVCPQNHGMWLDAGELPGTINFIAASPPPGVQPNYQPDAFRVREQVEFQVLGIKADVAQRQAKWKQAVVLFGVIVIALRVGFFIVRAKSSASRVQKEEQVIQRQANQQL